VVVCRQREVCPDMVKAREVVISRKKGLLRDGSYCERIYNKQKIARLLKSVGFRHLSIKSNLSLHNSKQDYGFLTSRMFVTATK
ncbi:MAG: hypothetical protein HQ595_04340, partial [Candidatus Omnitrophica bacterium]|nr:hypothetical protein [Candidatus Omnitrophota bacterium]